MNLCIDNLYLWPTEDGPGHYYYKINGIFYDADDLAKSSDSVKYNVDPVGSFNIYTDGSKLLAIELEEDGFVFQQLSSGIFIEVVPSNLNLSGSISEIYELEVPLPGGQEIDGVFQSLPLKSIEETIDKLWIEFEEDVDNSSQILEFLNV